jgi:hypothetical protein
VDRRERKRSALSRLPASGLGVDSNVGVGMVRTTSFFAQESALGYEKSAQQPTTEEEAK